MPHEVFSDDWMGLSVDGNCWLLRRLAVGRLVYAALQRVLVRRLRLLGRTVEAVQQGEHVRPA